QAAHLADPSDPGPVVLRDSQTFTSSQADTFSYNFSVPCTGQGPFSFVYTNNNSSASGGTFTMTHLGSVSCTNSAVSKAARGTYNQLAITGYGNWSKDPPGSAPRLLSASISLDPSGKYGLIMVFAKYPGEVQLIPNDDTRIIISSAENKPPTKPMP